MVKQLFLYYYSHLFHLNFSPAAFFHLNLLVNFIFSSVQRNRTKVVPTVLNFISQFYVLSDRKITHIKH